METNNYELTPKKFLTTLNIIHLGLLFFLLCFGIFVYTQNIESKLDLSITNNPFFFVVVMLAIGGVFMGNFMYKQQLSSLKTKNNLKQKLMGLQTASIIKYALIESPALLGFVMTMVEGNLIYLIISGLLILYFFSQKPKKSKIEMDLELNNEMKSQFSKVNEVIK